MAFLSASQTGLHAWLSVVTGVVVVDMIPVWPSALNHVLDVLLLVLLLFFSPSVLTYLLLSVYLLSFSSLLALAVAIQHPSRSFPVTLATSQGSSAPGETPGREREKERERERPKQSRVLPAAAHRTTLAVSIPPRQSQSYETLPYTINTAVVTRRLAVRPSNLQHGH